MKILTISAKMHLNEGCLHPSIHPIYCVPDQPAIQSCFELPPHICAESLSALSRICVIQCTGQWASCPWQHIQLCKKGPFYPTSKPTNLMETKDSKVTSRQKNSDNDLNFSTLSCVLFSHYRVYVDLLWWPLKQRQVSKAGETLALWCTMCLCRHAGSAVNKVLPKYCPRPLPVLKDYSPLNSLT